MRDPFFQFLFLDGREAFVGRLPEVRCRMMRLRWSDLCGTSPVPDCLLAYLNPFVTKDRPTSFVFGILFNSEEESHQLSIVAMGLGNCVVDEEKSCDQLRVIGGVAS